MTEGNLLFNEKEIEDMGNMSRKTILNRETWRNNYIDLIKYIGSIDIGIILLGTLFFNDIFNNISQYSIKVFSLMIIIFGINIILTLIIFFIHIYEGDKERELFFDPLFIYKDILNTKTEKEWEEIKKSNISSNDRLKLINTSNEFDKKLVPFKILFILRVLFYVLLVGSFIIGLILLIIFIINNIST